MTQDQTPKTENQAPKQDQAPTPKTEAKGPEGIPPHPAENDPRVVYLREMTNALSILANAKSGIDVLDDLRKGKHITQIEYNSAMNKIAALPRAMRLFAEPVKKKAAAPAAKPEVKPELRVIEGGDADVKAAVEDAVKEAEAEAKASDSLKN